MIKVTLFERILLFRANHFKKLEKNWAVIFDMDGVLVDNNPFHQKTWKIFCQKYDFELSQEQYRNQIYDRTNRGVLELSSELFHLHLCS